MLDFHKAQLIKKAQEVQKLRTKGIKHFPILASAVLAAKKWRKKSQQNRNPNSANRKVLFTTRSAAAISNADNIPAHSEVDKSLVSTSPS